MFSTWLNRARWRWVWGTAGWLWVLLAPSVAGAADGHVPRLLYLQDRTGVWAPGLTEPAPGFRPVSDRAAGANFGTREGVIWFKAELPSAEWPSGEWRWVVHNPHLDRITVTARADDGRETTWNGGNLAPDRDTTVRRHPEPIAPIVLREGHSHTVFMRVESSGIFYVPVSLVRPDTQWQRDQTGYALRALYFGLALGLFAYNVLLYLAIRERVYLYYIACILGLVVSQLANTGLGAQFFWPSQAANGTSLHNGAIALAILFAIQFVRSFLDTAAALPGIDRWLRGTVGLWVLTLLVLPWVDRVTAGLVLAPAGLMTVALLMLTAIAALRAGRPGATYFSLAWATLLASGALFALLRLGVLPHHPLLADVIMLGSSIELVLLSFALADRIRADRHARDEAVAERVQASAQRAATQEALDERTRFVAAVMHDLQQPLYALSLAAQSLERHPAAPSLESPLSQMNSAIESAGRLLSSMTMLVRLDRASVTPDIVAFSMQGLIERLDTMFAPLARQRGLQWRANPTLARVQSDPDLVERMLSNLIANAIRYTEHGGVLVTCRSRRAGLLVQVWDTGPGIEAAALEGLFEEHVRGPGAQEGDRGLGLGLSIVLRCAGLLGVKLSVRSVPGKGSSFGCLIPWAHEPLGTAPTLRG